MIFRLAERGGKLTGTMDSPDQGANGIPIDQAQAGGGALRLQVGRVKGHLYRADQQRRECHDRDLAPGHVPAPLLRRTGGAAARSDRRLGRAP